ncbi:MAG TPA: hypothetical protein DCE56_22395, partial [Cyanobacteria bacterium UBA8553]|nr:hypothetical protein [Cyanobacteria bacterium UBA8553]
YWQKTVPGRFGSKQKVLFLTAQGLPATFDGGVARPDTQVVTHIFEQLVNPILNLIEKYKERADAPTPKVILQFATFSDFESVKDTSCDQVQQQAFSGEQPEANYTIEEPRWSLEKVILPTQTRTSLEQTLNLIEKHDLIYKKWGLASVLGNTSPAISINLFGPPGTGKTRCAEGIAHALGRKLLRINFAQLESKFVGQTSQNIMAVFKRAAEHNAVLFFDEADNALGARLSNIADAAGQGLNTSRNTMLIEMEKFEGVVIFATNNVRAFDQASASRILYNIPFTLPDADSRLRIFKLHIPPEFPLADDISLERIVDLTDGFCGRQIWNVVRQTAAKAASQECPDIDKRVTMKDFVDSIEEVRKGSDAIFARQETQSLTWLSTKVKPMIDDTTNSEKANT